MILLTLTSLLLTAGNADYKTESTRCASVRYRDIPREYATAFAEIVSTARDVCAKDFGFRMPDTISLTAEVVPAQPMLLYADSPTSLYLRVPSVRQLGRPMISQTDWVYALCREVGRLAIHGCLKGCPWMKDSAYEGCTHYLGSYLVDAVSKQLGPHLYPDEYDYAAAGLHRLSWELSQTIRCPTVIGAGAWEQLSGLLPRGGLGNILSALGQASVEPNNPGMAILTTLQKVSKNKQEIVGWWAKIRDAVLGTVRPADALPERLDWRYLSGSPAVLKYGSDPPDEGQADRCNGYAIHYASPPGRWYLTGIRFFALRYGQSLEWHQEATVRLYDDRRKEVDRSRMPLGMARGSKTQWVRVPLIPTRVASVFSVSVSFDATRENGVEIRQDRSTRGHSLARPRGQSWQRVDDGDWMIQVELDRTKDADPLIDPRQWPIEVRPISRTASTQPSTRP